jgi:hypothetical protein
MIEELTPLMNPGVVTKLLDRQGSIHEVIYVRARLWRLLYIKTDQIFAINCQLSTVNCLALFIFHIALKFDDRLPYPQFPLSVFLLKIEQPIRLILNFL